MKNPIGIGDASSIVTNQWTDWSLARERGCEFGLVRACTTGSWFNGNLGVVEDSMFALNSHRMIAAGIKRIPYAWYDPRFKFCSPVDQAGVFLEILKRNGGPGELGPLIYLEDSPESGAIHFVGTGKYIRCWLDTVESALGMKPRIYTSYSFVQRYLFNANLKEDWLSSYGLILADAGKAMPSIPQPWGPANLDAWLYRFNVLGNDYGFYNQSGFSYHFPLISLMVWNGELP